MSEVYFLRPVGQDGPVKIGYSSYADNRLLTYLEWSPIPLEIAARIDAPPEVERRFHGAFQHLHSHHEWFNAAPELTQAIDQVAAGAFDIATLPAPVDVRRKGPYPKEASRAGANSRRVDRIRWAGVPIPDEVKECLHTYQQPDAEKARRRAVVQKFVDDHRHVVGASRRQAKGRAA